MHIKNRPFQDISVFLGKKYKRSKFRVSLTRISRITKALLVRALKFHRTQTVQNKKASQFSIKKKGKLSIGNAK